MSALHLWRWFVGDTRGTNRMNEQMRRRWRREQRGWWLWSSDRWCPDLDEWGVRNPAGDKIGGRTHGRWAGGESKGNKSLLQQTEGDRASVDVFYCMVHRFVGVCLLCLLCLLCLFSVGNDLSCPPHLSFLSSSAPVSSQPSLTLMTLTGLSCVSLSPLPFFLSQTL